MSTRMKSDERRAAIVRQAVHLFAENGFRGTTTRELAAAVGVTEPVLYQHFANKRELYSAIIATKGAEGQQAAGDFAAWLEGRDDRGFFTYLANLVLERYEQDPDFMRLLMFSALEGHELAEEFFDRHIRHFQEVVAGYIRRRTQEGAFRDANPHVAARMFIGMMGNYGLGQLLFPKHALKVPRKKVIEEMVTTFLCGLGRAHSPNGDRR